MALNSTTLSGAITSSQTSFGVASATGISVPNNQTGSGFTFLLVEQEFMFVTGVTGTVVSVLRGQGGTQAVAHGITAAVVAGLPSDFPGFVPAQGSFVQLPNFYRGVSAPVASATTITATGELFHITGTTAIATINPPPGGGFSGQITVIPDGIWTWTAAGNINTAGTTTAANIPVTFYYDDGLKKWFASRLA
jgi:hypothetical protein